MIKEAPDFKASVSQLKQLTDYQSAKSGRSHKQLKEWGGILALKKNLNIEYLQQGINCEDDSEIEQKQKIYGRNKIKFRDVYEKRSIFWFIKDQVQEVLLILVGGLALIDILLGMWDLGLQIGWQEGLSQIMFLFVLLLGYSFFKWIKYFRFQKLAKVLRKAQCYVIRKGIPLQIMAKNLVVGDTVLLEAGDFVPADGILFESGNLQISEVWQNGETVEKFCVYEEFQKSEEEEEESKENKLKDVDDDEDDEEQPEDKQKKEEEKKKQQQKEKEVFVFSQSRVLSGSGKMLVLSVGENSYLNEVKEDFYRNYYYDQSTPLHDNIWLTTNLVESYVTSAIQILFILMIFMIFLQTYQYEDYKFFSVRNLRYFLQHNIIICFLAILLSITDQSVLVHTFFKALHINKLFKTGVIPQTVNSVDSLALIDTMVIDKTGIVTEEQFEVRNIWILQQYYTFSPAEDDQEKRKQQNQEFFSALSPELQKIFFFGLCVNSDADPDFKNQEQFSNLYQRGNQTDIAMLKFVQSFGIDYKNLRTSKLIGGANKPDLTQHNLMWSIHQLTNEKTLVFVKGSFDYIKGICKFYIDKDGQKQDITYEYVDEVYQVIKKYEYEFKQRIILLAYKELDPKVMKKSLSYEKLDGQVTSSLILVGFIGLDNKVKEEIPQQIATLQNDLGVDVRVVTKDQLRQAVSVARSVGLLSKDKNMDQLQKDFEVMTGLQLIDIVGFEENKERIERKKEQDEEDKKKKEKLEKQQQYGNKNQGEEEEDQGPQKPHYKTLPRYVIKNPSHKAECIAKNLKVLARATPTQKLCFQILLQYYQYKAGFTKNGISEELIVSELLLSASLHKQGKQSDEAESHISLKNDSLGDLIEGIKFSRVMWIAVKAYYSFYISTSAVTIFVLLWSEFSCLRSSLDPTFLIIQKIIIDIFATVYYMADYKHIFKYQIKNTPETSYKDFINKSLKRSIQCVSIIQILILGFSLLYLEYYYGLNLMQQFQELDTEENLVFLNGVRRSIFNGLFLYLTTFSVIHYRQIQNKGQGKYLQNMLLNFSNYILLAIMFGIHALTTQYGSYLGLGTSPLTPQQYGQCMGIGSFSLIFGFIGTIIFPNQEVSYQNRQDYVFGSKIKTS